MLYFWLKKKTLASENFNTENSRMQLEKGNEQEKQ